MAAQKDDSPFLTTGGRLRNFLGWAFVLSILMHLVLGPLIPFKATEAHDQETEKVSVTKKIKVKVPTPPPPTPTPKPTVQPKTTPPPKKQVTVPQPKLKVQPPKTTANGGSGPTENKYVPPPKGSENGVPQGNTATGEPKPASTPGPPASTPPPKPQCAVPTKDASMTNGVAPEYPEVAKEQNLGPVVVLVKITLSASASVQDASILQSSGNSAIDRAAIVAARQSSYAPAIENCQPVAGTYSFRASFDPSQ